MLNVPRLNNNQSHRMPVTSPVTTPYSGTSNQTQIANTHSIPHADPSMLSNTRGHIPSVTLNTPRRRSKKSASFPLSHVPLSDFLLLLIWIPPTWPLSQIGRKSVTATREKLSRSLNITRPGRRDVNIACYSNPGDAKNRPHWRHWAAMHRWIPVNSWQFP